jgi:hypothetical protein
MAYPTYKDSNGFVRFESNDNIPFADYLEENHPELSAEQIEAHKAQREEDNMKWINEVYIPAQQNKSEEQKAEEAFEMRAAFGPGEKIVNIITGEVSYS